MLGTLIPFGLAIFVPFLGLVGLVGFVFVKYAVVVMVVRWWVKFGKLKTDDPDFSKARGTVTWVSVVAALVSLFVRVHLFGLRI